jgi:predicted DNA repair protein MutK
MALVVVALAITAGVYGVVALIVKLDDIGLHMAQRRRRATRAFGNLLVHVVPKLLTALSGIGTAAMLWVGGGILLHGFEEIPVVDAIPHAVHDLATRAGEAAGVASGLAAWTVTALGGAVVGIVVGAILAAFVRRFTKRPEELIVD